MGSAVAEIAEGPSGPVSPVVGVGIVSDSASDFPFDQLDEEIIADLAAVGIDLSKGPDLEQSQREAAAAILLRLMVRGDDEIARLTEAMDLELELIRTHYAGLLETPQRRQAECQRHIECLAEVSALRGGFGKKKSASTPYGSFGIRHAAATVELSDSDALLAHLKESDPARVKVTAVFPLTEAREYLSETELAKTKMEPKWSDVKASLDPEKELPPGVSKVPAVDSPFAKPQKRAALQAAMARTAGVDQ